MINLKVGKNAMANKNLIQFEEGDLVDGRYKIIKSLGEGGMASVWKAYDIKTDTEVAIKMAKLPTESEGIKKSRSRYKNELAAFAVLNSDRHVVSLHDMFETESTLVIVMECAEGGTLNNRYRDFYDMTLEEVKFYFSRLCLALEAATRYNIVHRDIKLDNVLIGTDGEVKLADFGISIKNIDDLEAKSTIGTPKYMSPEVCDGQIATHLSDIYSLGIMMYECATGVAPFIFKSTNGSTQNSFLMIMQRFGKPLAPSKINKKIPQALENLILQMLEKNPEFRPQSAAEVRKSLLAIKRENAENVKPYVYRSKAFHGVKNRKKISSVGNVYSSLKGRFRTKFSLAFWIILFLIVVGLIVEMVVLI
jgi:serine/threonine protein kinase